jgi:hypothetical protein
LAIDPIERDYLTNGVHPIEERTSVFLEVGKASKATPQWEGEEVKIPDRPSEPETLSLGRVEKIKGVVKDLSVDKRDQWQIITKIAPGVDWNNQLVVVMCFMRTSASIHVMLQSVFLKGFTAARSKRSFCRCSFKVPLGQPIAEFS